MLAVLIACVLVSATAALAMGFADEVVLPLVAAAAGLVAWLEAG